MNTETDPSNDSELLAEVTDRRSIPQTTDTNFIATGSRKHPRAEDDEVASASTAKFDHDSRVENGERDHGRNQVLLSPLVLSGFQELQERYAQYEISSQSVQKDFSQFLHDFARRQAQDAENSQKDRLDDKKTLEQLRQENIDLKGRNDRLSQLNQDLAVERNELQLQFEILQAELEQAKSNFKHQIHKLTLENVRLRDV